MVEKITLVNNSFGTSLSIDQDTRIFVLESVDWGEVSGSNKTYKFIDQVGSYVTKTTLESRDVSIIGWIVADSENQMKERKTFLNKFVSPLHRLTLKYNGYSIEGIPDSSVSYSKTYKENNDVICKFGINLFCPDPMFHPENPALESIADWIPAFEFPLEIPEGEGIMMGERSQSTIVQIDNEGDIPCGFTLRFEAEGTVENPEVIDIDSQSKIRFSYTMSAGDVLEVCTVTNQKGATLIKSGLTTNAFNLLDFEKTSFFQLALGSNYIRYGADSGVDNLSVTIEYNPSYLEVETL